MKTKISNLQVIFLTANFVFTSAIISLPQIIISVGGQNGWMVPIILFPFFLLLIYLLFGRKRNMDSLKNMFRLEPKEKRNFLEKGFAVLFLVTVIFVLLRDLRAAVDFVATVLLPTTPIEMITILIVLVICYIAMSGLEVISRINALHFSFLIIIVLLLPFLLLNEIEIRNLQPLPSIITIMNVLKACVLSLSWVGEVFFFLLVVSHMNPVKEARRAVVIGTGLTLLLFTIILIVEISVLGPRLVQEATYPTFILIQQINVTDFLDRLDPFIVVIWLPTIITKITYLLYAVNHCTSLLLKIDTNKFLLPVTIILGYLSLLLFKNNIDHLHFSFYTWSTLGLILEVLILVVFWMVRRKAQKTASKENVPAD